MTLYATNGSASADYGWSMSFDPVTVTFMVGAPFQSKDGCWVRLITASVFIRVLM
jgi:hypothetical protein